MTKELLRLFKAVIVEKSDEFNDNSSYTKRMLNNGYLVANNVKVTNELLDEIESVYGLNQKQVNNSFHKSFHKVANSSRLELTIHQMLHYLTTYGFESLGIKGDYVYIPLEDQELPKLGHVAFIYIRGYTKSEILELIRHMDSANVGLHDDTLKDLTVIIKGLKIPYEFFSDFTNREILAIVNSIYDKIPQNPEMWLRSLIHKLTGESLLIKNDYLISKIKYPNDPGIISEYISNAPDNLASIFYRYKPLFLALKKVSKDKAFFNRLRREAVKKHVPVYPPKYKSITALIKSGGVDIKKALIKANLTDKVKLHNTLKLYRKLGEDGSSRVFRIRNGKLYIKQEEFEFDCSHRMIFDVLCSIRDDLRHLSGVKFYIPENVSYAFPVSGKQFVGNFPYGTWIGFDGKFVVGIHWENYGHHRIDLDLSATNLNGKIGWNAIFSDGDAVYSGDMTDARPNATEAILFAKGSGYSVISNYFNYNSHVANEMYFKLFLAKGDDISLKRNPKYLLDKNNIVLSTSLKHSHKAIYLGFVLDNGFYFFGGNGKFNVAGRQDEYINYLTCEAATKLSLRNVLTGIVEFVDDPDKADIDLSPDVVTQETFLSLLSPELFEKDNSA